MKRRLARRKLILNIKNEQNNNNKIIIIKIPKPIKTSDVQGPKGELIIQMKTLVLVDPPKRDCLYNSTQVPKI